MMMMMMMMMMMVVLMEEEGQWGVCVLMLKGPLLVSITEFVHIVLHCVFLSSHQSDTC